MQLGIEPSSFSVNSGAHTPCLLLHNKNLVSVARIELALHAPKARVIPFHYTEKNWSSHYDSHVNVRWTPTRLLSDCKKMVPTIGFELMTYRLQGDCTTTVLSRQKLIYLWWRPRKSNPSRQHPCKGYP